MEFNVHIFSHLHDNLHMSYLFFQVRLQLQSCVSRQQEALRCREVWLLGQIELIEQLKTETLQQQLHQLHRVSQFLCFRPSSLLPAYLFYSKIEIPAK